MTRKLTRILSVVLIMLVLAGTCVSFAASGDYIVYKIPEYIDAADPSNKTADDAKMFVQGVDWDKVYSDSEGGINEQLFWSIDKSEVDSAPTLTIPLTVDKAGVYSVALKLFIGGDFGIFDVFLGDAQIANDLDCFGDAGLSFINLGNHQIAAGIQNLVFKNVGFNAGNTAPGCHLGISRLTLGTPGYYRMVTYIGSAVASNKTADDPKMFVQNMDRDWKAANRAHNVLPEDLGQLFWLNDAAGNTFTIPLNVTSAGEYEVSMNLFFGGDFGQFEIRLGDALLAESIDCFGDAGLTETAMGKATLSAGTQNLVIKSLGKNENNTADAGFNFGINSLTLKAVGGTGSGNPKTGDSALPLGITAVFAVSLLGVFVISKKIRA